MVRLGVPLSTAAATRAMLSPGRQRQASALAQTSSKLSARLAKPGRQSSDCAVCMESLWVGTRPGQRDENHRIERQRSPVRSLTAFETPPSLIRLNAATDNGFRDFPRASRANGGLSPF